MPEKNILLDEYVFWGWSFSQPQTTLKVLRNSLLQVFCVAFLALVDIKTMRATQAMTNTTQETCDLWGTNYNSYIWEPKFLTIFVTWQLRATIDSISNFYEVLRLKFLTTATTLPSLVQVLTFYFFGTFCSLVEN